MKNTKEMTDDQLLEDLLIWFRIGRNEGGLNLEERTYFQSLVKEIKNRNLLNRNQLYHG
jgi:hypothetical protein